MIKQKRSHRRAFARTSVACAAVGVVEQLELRTLLAAAPITIHPLEGLSSVAAGRAQTGPATLVASGLYNRVLSLGASPSAIPEAVATRALSPFSIELDTLKQLLDDAPLEFSPAAATGAVVLPLPMPDGSLSRFRIVEAPVMDPLLAAKFPDIRTFRGEGMDDPTASVRLDYTPLGFHAQVLSQRGSYYIDPFHRNDADGTYASYYKRDAIGRDAWVCDVRESDVVSEISANQLSEDAVVPSLVVGGQLRTYRAAVAADAEYTQAVGGGSVSGGQAAVVTAMTRVTGVYETELGIRLTLVANNSSLIYTNAATDPYNNDADDIDLNTPNINSVIGVNNYDIGHVFTTGSGGVAYLGSVGDSGIKGGGTTGLPSPTGDAFYIDYVAHEMGHQFGANHTFNTSNDSLNRNAGTAYEPGSGSTIMAYAGIEGAEDLQPHSDPYFHSASLDEIRDFVTLDIPSVGVVTSISNQAPTVDAGANYTIPTGTPFQLTATGSDPDGDPLTYDWQQRDLGPARLLTATDQGTIPLFRAWSPTSSPTRVLPQLSSILGGTNQTFNTSGRPVEKLFSVARTSTWRVIARDNKVGGGGVSTDDMTLTVVSTGSAFSVTAPNTAVTWSGGSSQTVTWNVAGTTANGINVANVKISLSTDGGLTFPTILAASTANDGSQSITVPSAITTSTARIKVEAIGNIFFDISNTNFNITADNVPGNLSGQTFEDRDSNGTLGGSDVALNGVTVFLDTNNNTILDGGEPSVVTTGAGNYAFNSITSGTYHLREQIPAGYIATSPTGGAVDVSVTGASTTTQNLGNFPIVYSGTGSGDTYEVRQSSVVTPPYSDNFNRATLAGGSSTYTTTVTGGDGGASVVGSDILTLTNDVGGTANASGVVYVTTPTSAFAGFNQQLSSNTDLITWSFNMQQMRTNPGGLGGGSYGAAYVLGATSGVFSGASAGNGYAVVVGNSSTPDPIRLVRFAGGVADANLTELTAGTVAVSNHYWSVQVTYNPSNNQWKLYTRDDGTSSFADPTTATTQVGSTVADGTYTASNLTHVGPLWSYSTTASQVARFDNIKLAVGTTGGSSNKTEILLGNVVTYSIDKALLPSLTFNPGAGDDLLTVNYTNGSPMPTGGIFYDGGANTDGLIITGTPSADAVTLANAFAGPSSGNINLNNASTGVQTVETATFNALVGNDTLTVASAPSTAIVFNGGLTPTDQDTLNLNAGSHNFSTTDFAATTYNLTLNVSGASTSVALGTTHHLTALNVSNNATVSLANASTTLVTKSLAITTGAKLDIGPAAVAVNYPGPQPTDSWTGGVYTGVTGLVASGRNGGTWDGSGIVSSLATPDGYTGVGVAEASDILASATDPWRNQTLDHTTVLVKYTYGGDANLSGSVDVDDYGQIDYNASTGGVLTGWFNGDFDFSGSQDVDDYGVIDFVVNIQGDPL